MVRRLHPSFREIRDSGKHDQENNNVNKANQRYEDAESAHRVSCRNVAMFDSRH
jgi:hypothetical protein